jgi:hypothetical protein
MRDTVARLRRFGNRVVPGSRRCGVAVAERGGVNRNAGRGEHRTVCGLRGAAQPRGGPGGTARVVIGTDGVVQDVMRSELRMAEHRDGALQALG